MIVIRQASRLFCAASLQASCCISCAGRSACQYTLIPIRPRPDSRPAMSNDDSNDDDDYGDDGDGGGSSSSSSSSSSSNHNHNHNHDDRIQRRNSRFLTISSLRREPSPTRTLKWSGRNCVQITWNTSSADHVQSVTCHVVRRDSSAIKFDRVEIAFILALFYWLNN